MAAIKTERDASARIGGENRNIGAKRKYCRMSDVQNAQQAINKCKAYRHHRVHASEADAGYG